MDPETSRLIDRAPLVLVDFDGTLASLQTDWNGLRQDLAETARQSGWGWNTVDGLDVNLRRIRSENGDIAFRRLCARVATFELAGFDPSAVAFDLLDRLARRRPDPVVIVTNNTRAAVSEILKHPVFDGIRPRIIGKEDVRRSKPSPEGVLRACRLFVASPRKSIFLGDSDADAEAARSAELAAFIRVTPPTSTQLRTAA